MFTSGEGVVALSGGITGISLLLQTGISKYFDGKRDERMIDSQIRLKREEQSFQRSDWRAKETLDAAKHIYSYVTAWANHAAEGAKYLSELAQGRTFQPSTPPNLQSDNTMDIATLAALANLEVSKEFYGFTTQCNIFENVVRSAFGKIQHPESEPEISLDDMVETAKSLSKDISERASKFQRLINEHFRDV